MANENEGLHFISATFDIQAILSIPFASDGQIYYNRELELYYYVVT